ncbi:multivesicular body subunit 12B [Galendromus occidentalis]|uniref:Multivesicular body subunit 12B n=1 Tax=Galendromus occidentalis TaxID=34638 RepID=A0AAJ7L3A7_9ACAR|nr:multivesicular body subunit 12B [Galendromus occidentalis]
MEPITDLCIVEDARNAPSGFTVIELTGDTGQDADLWKDKGFFGKKETRYLCFSRKFSLDCVESLSVTTTSTPDVLTVSLTRDTAQKAFRKRNLCYTVVGRDILNCRVVTEIGVFSKLQDGFLVAGELNNLVIGYKTVLMNAGASKPDPKVNLFEKVYTIKTSTVTTTKCVRSWIDDVPFRLSPVFQPITRLTPMNLKTASQIYCQYNYDFSIERDVLQASPELPDGLIDDI